MIEESFMKAVFHGVIEESVVFPYPGAGPVEVDNLNAMLDSGAPVLRTRTSIRPRSTATTPSATRSCQG
jgi:hypothetical protein